MIRSWDKTLNVNGGINTYDNAPIIIYGDGVDFIDMNF